MTPHHDVYLAVFEKTMAFSHQLPISWIANLVTVSGCYTDPVTAICSELLRPVVTGDIANLGNEAAKWPE